MKVNGEDLLKFLENKISEDSREELNLWVKCTGKRFGILKPKFHLEIEDAGFTIKYFSTGCYIGEGTLEVHKVKRIK